MFYIIIICSILAIPITDCLYYPSLKRHSSNLIQLNSKYQNLKLRIQNPTLLEKLLHYGSNIIANLEIILINLILLITNIIAITTNVTNQSNTYILMITSLTSVIIVLLIDTIYNIIQLRITKQLIIQETK